MMFHLVLDAYSVLTSATAGGGYTTCVNVARHDRRGSQQKLGKHMNTNILENDL